jgi:hypothetical protein
MYTRLENQQLLGNQTFNFIRTLGKPNVCLHVWISFSFISAPFYQRLQKATHPNENHQLLRIVLLPLLQEFKFQAPQAVKTVEVVSR